MSLFTTANKPVITVMVDGRTEKRVLELIRLTLEAGGADAFGLQMDGLLREEHTPESISRIVRACEGKPLYVTNYAGNQNAGLPDEQLCDELLEAIDCGAALADIPADFFHHVPHQITYDEAAVEKQMEVIRKVHQHGGEALMSTHSFCFHNTAEVLRIADAHRYRGADISKIVISANSEEEEFMNYQTELELRRSFRMRHLFLSAGACVKQHRLIGPILGSSLFLTVYERDEYAAKSQPLLKDAFHVLKACGMSLQE